MRPALKVRHGVLALAALCACESGWAARDGGTGDSGGVGSGASYDVILRHGTVIDGSGRARYVADVGVRNGRIARIGRLDDARATLVIEARGLIVAPGFINIHSHADAAGLQGAANMLSQGVTTEILNPDGVGPLDLSAQLHSLQESGLAENVGAYIGFNSVWKEVMGPTDHRAGPDDIRRMRDLTQRGLEQGAFGVSAGLDYKPAYFATTEEVVRVVSVAAGWRTNFPDHERITPPAYSSRTGIAETITIASAAGLAPEITHIKAQGHEQGRAGEIVRMMEHATASGHYTPSDVYPYLAGKTGLADLLIPAWAQDGGSAALLARFRQPGLRARIAAESGAIMDARLTGGAAGVYFPESKTRLVDLMHAEKAAAGEMVIRLIERAGGAVIPTVLQFGAETDLETFIENGTTAIACDCGATTQRPTHPRYSGAFPRVLARYVRERRLLSLEQAIYKMTGLPASIVGIVDRGLLSVGMAADITVFDPETIIDHATFEEPALASDGVREVLVNGRSEWHEGRATGSRGGTALFRARSMPTRTASFGADRAAQAGSAMESRESPGASPPASRRGPGSWRLSLRVRQGRASSHAEGSLRVTDGSRVVLDMLDFGELQTSGGWAALSGMARSEGTIGPVTIIIDASDPALAPGRALVSVEGPLGHREWTLPAKAFILESARTGSPRR